jgi:hypothetical protein
VEEAPPAETSKSVLSLREEEDPVAAPAVNPISISPIDALAVVAGTNLIGKRSLSRMKLTGKFLPQKMTMLSLWVVGLRRGSDGGLGTLLLALALILA